MPAETIRFFSRNAANFQELLSDETRAELAPAAVSGVLNLPEDTSRPIPLVITSLGPGGFAAGRGGPILAVLAERDDMAPLDRQRERMAELTAAGADLETIAIPLVGHSFDAVYPASFRNGANFCNWDIAVDDDGTMQETKSGVRDDGDWSEFLQAIRAARDTTSGGTTGYGGAARNVAVAPVLAFLTKTLLQR